MTSTQTVLRRPGVKARVGLSRSQIDALVRAGKFPRPIKLGARASGWLAHEIDAWIADRVAESRGEAAA